MENGKCRGLTSGVNGASQATGFTIYHLPYVIFISEWTGLSAEASSLQEDVKMTQLHGFASKVRFLSNSHPALAGWLS